MNIQETTDKLVPPIVMVDVVMVDDPVDDSMDVAVDTVVAVDAVMGDVIPTIIHQQNKKSEGIYLPDEVFESVPRKYHALLYKGRDQMEIETNNIHPSRKNKSKSSNEQRTTSRVEILEDNDDDFKADNNQNDDNDTGGASAKFGATGRKNKKVRIGAIQSSVRRISRSHSTSQQTLDYDCRARAEIDTRADTLCAGSTFILYENTGKVVDVSGFHDSYNAIKNIPVGLFFIHRVWSME
jgi:hypothetical protein